MYKVLFLIIVSLFLACSSERPAGVDKQKPAETGGNVPGITQPSVPAISATYSLEIIPADASRNSTLNLIPKGFNLPDAKIEWLVNGKLVISPTPNQFKAIETKKGDAVQAKTIIKGKEVLSNVIQIKNALPEISKVKILPEVFKPGDTLYVDVAGSDIDEDAVTILYEWTKNGEPAGKSKQIEVPIKRGDKVDIKITPFDGEDYGRSIILHREIRNLPPMVIEDKKFNFDGNVFTYQVKATDPDGDPLAYSLKTAPAGMTIDPSTGMIQWDVPPDFKGRVSITVYVTDDHGGEAVQSFVFEITTEKRP